MYHHASYTHKVKEIQHYFTDFLDNYSDWLNENDDIDQSDVHHEAFNTSYYVDGTQEAIDWLGDSVYEVIGAVICYEKFNFGELYTDVSDPVKLANMYVYIVGEEIVADWFQRYEMKKA